jgi:hypothetical protein
MCQDLEDYLSVPTGVVLNTADPFIFQTLTAGIWFSILFSSVRPNQTGALLLDAKYCIHDGEGRVGWRR